MRRSLLFAAVAVTIALGAPSTRAAAADLGIAATTPVVVQAAAPPARTISLTTTSHVDYVPDVALLSLGVRSSAATAAAAAERTNDVGAKMLAALEGLGIEKKAIATSQYDVTFVDAVPPVYAPAAAGRARVLTQPGRPAHYDVTTTFAVRAPVAKAGAAIDAAIRAGANASYGLSFVSSHIDDAYAQALAAAMQSARVRAAALAAAAGVSLDALQSVSTSGAQPSGDAAPQTAAAFGSARMAPVVAGTQSVDASVDVVYTIK